MKARDAVPEIGGAEGRAGAILLIVVAMLVALFLALRFGAEPISWESFFRVLRGGSAGTEPAFDSDRIILLQLRFPRVLLGFLLGGGLALSGAVFQALLRNPLAEPYILGVSGGAAAATVVVLALGIASAGSIYLPVASFAGGIFAVLLVFGVARAAGPRLDVGVLLLSGIVVGSFFTAIISLFVSLSDAPIVRSAMLWMLGSLSGAGWRSAALVALYTLPFVILALTFARALNLIAIGEETAEFLGIRVERTKRIAFGAASFLAAAGVAFAGIIGFVGLIVPHAVRLVVGSDHRVLLPATFMAGAIFLTLADLLARTVAAPLEIPIGVVTSFVGVPFFLFLLVTRGKR